MVLFYKKTFNQHLFLFYNHLFSKKKKNLSANLKLGIQNINLL